MSVVIDLGKGVDSRYGDREVAFKLKSLGEKESGKELVVQRGQQVQRPEMGKLLVIWKKQPGSQDRTRVSQGDSDTGEVGVVTRRQIIEGPSLYQCLPLL